MKFQVQLLERIDGERGGFADVWRARRLDILEEVAVKKLRDFQNADARRRFRDEVKILKHLQHPAIMTILDDDLDGAEPYYVMPLMQGGCLTTWTGRLSHAITRDLGRWFAAAVHYMHSRGTLHRDLKPDNILIDGAGLCKIADLGLGNAPHCSIRVTAGTAGTYGYMAPELGHGGKPSTASDVYALGATVFHILTGVHPAQAATLDPWAYRRDVPQDLRDLVLRMVNSDQANRPAAAEVVAAFDGVVPNPVRAPEKAAAAPAPQKKPISQHQPAPAPQRDGAGDALAALLGFAAVAGLVALVGAALSDSGPPPRIRRRRG